MHFSSRSARSGSASLPDHARSDRQADTAQPRTLAEIEKEAVLAALERNQGDRRRTAAELGISLRTLQYRLKDYGMVRPGPESGEEKGA